MSPRREWEDMLDSAARVNLSAAAQARYFAYKAEVLERPDAEEILRGWIWDESAEEIERTA